MNKRGGVAERQNFSTRMAARILAISPERIRYWVKRNLVKPAAVRGRHYQFTFEDLLMMRLAKELLPNRRRLQAVAQCFQRVGRMLDASRPVTAVKLYEERGLILVRDGAVTFEAETGQMRFDYRNGPSSQTINQADAPVRLRRLVDAAAGLEETNPARAAQLYREYLQYRPRDGTVHHRLSALFERIGDTGSAVRHLDAAAVLEPNNAELHFDLGVLYRKLENMEQAAASFTRALECEPDLIEAHLHLAQIHEQQGQKREAMRHLSAAHRLINQD
jgi:MerR HTH family regulatory protein/Tetratricopeptide repeat